MKKLKLDNNKIIKFNYENSIDSLTNLLALYKKITCEQFLEHIQLQIFVPEIVPWHITWPNQKNMCFRTLRFAIEHMTNEKITVELFHE